MTDNFKAAYAACIGSLALLKKKYPKFINVGGEKLTVTYKDGCCLCGGYFAYAQISDCGIALLSDVSMPEILTEHEKHIVRLFSVAAGVADDFGGIDIHLKDVI